MNPRASLRLVNEGSELQINWHGFHPGDDAEEKITSTVMKQIGQDLSVIETVKGQIIYIRWWAEHSFGISISMDAILDDFYRIGLDTYNWSLYLKEYLSARPSSWPELEELLEQNHDDPEIKEIMKEIHREWFDIALKGGTFSLDTSAWDYHYNVANVFGFFPWIIFFTTGGRLTEEALEFNVEISASFEVDEDEIFEHLDGELDEQFWLLIYSFVLQLDNIPSEERGDKWYRFLQAVHEFTSDTDDYLRKLQNMHEYEDLLTIFDTTFLLDYVQNLLQYIAEEESTAEICNTLLDFSAFLLRFDFTDLAKLTEATTLEHALQLEDPVGRHEVILELTKRSSSWGEGHLISFIQSLIGLLPQDNHGKELLSDVINQVTDELRKSWDGLLCIVEAKIIADRIGDAIDMRFQATNRIGDRQTKSGDVFSALIWSLQYKFEPEQRQAIAKSYLDTALEYLPGEAIIDQCDVVIQTCLNFKEHEYLRLFLRYIRKGLPLLEARHHSRLVERIEELFSLSPSNPMIGIELLLMRLYVLHHSELPVDPDQPFQLVSQIYNSINPTLSSAAEDLQYISESIIRFALLNGQWSLVEEARRRYLLLASDRDRATKHLKTMFFRNSINRAKVPSKELKNNDIGIRLFNEGLGLADLAQDYELIMKILPSIKKLAIKSRSFSEFTELVLTEVKLQRLKSGEWFDQLEEDIRLLIKRGNSLDVTMIFSQLFGLDLSEDDRRRLLTLQLQLSESEPDLLTSDEVYDKRLELAKLRGEEDSEEQQQFMIDNYQRGISELMSKGDSKNLTNLLFDALEYSNDKDAKATEEFKVILLDNFENITQDVSVQSAFSVYQYLLTVWRKVIGAFGQNDFEIVITTTIRLLQLNLQLFRKSDNNQYLRRTHLVLQEFSQAADRYKVTFGEEELMVLEPFYNQVMEAMTADQEDFGIITAIFQSAQFYHKTGNTQNFLPILDRGINKIKQQILSDPDAHSAIFLLLLVLSELNQTLEADLYTEIQEQLLSRVKRVLNFAESLKLNEGTAKEVRGIQNRIRQDPSSFFYDYPFSIGTYLNEMG